MTPDLLLSLRFERLREGDVDTSGFFRIGTLEASPAELVEALGFADPVESFDGKVEARLLFGGEVFKRTKTDSFRGAVLDRASGPLIIGFVSVYPYKKTAGYDPELPISAGFWASTDPVSFSIGGRSPAFAGLFLSWARFVHNLGGLL